MKKYSPILYLIFLLVSCKETDEKNVIHVDLNDTLPCINYSSFVESVEYRDLHITDSLPVGSVERLYLDKDKIFVQDGGNEGILVFDHLSGNLLKRINCFGEGPKEIKRISAFCLDTYHSLVCIFDDGDMKIKMYDYSGNYVSSYPTKDFFIDMVKLDEHTMTYFYPIYANGEQNEGVWTSDTLGHFKKRMTSCVTEECKFHYFPMMYNYNGSSAYYYDRNWDELSVVTPDSLQKLYTFDLQQSIPMHKRGNRSITPYDLDGDAILHVFACSEHFLLLAFHSFDKADIRKKNITWLLMNTETGEKMISNHLKNDLTTKDESTDNSLFYVNNRTWIRTDNSSEDLLRLQVLHLK